jgi:hypothetical protein
MPYRITILILFVAASLIAACSGSGFKETSTQLTGIAVIVGNEPFSEISLQGTDGKTYRLQADSLTLSVFRLNQGGKFMVSGIVRNGLMGPVLQIESFVKK